MLLATVYWTGSQYSSYLLLPDWPPRGSVKQPYSYNQTESSEDTSESYTSTSASVEETTSDIKDEIEQEITILARNAAAARVDYSGAQLWKVSTDKPGVRAVLGRLKRRNRKYKSNKLRAYLISPVTGG